MHALLRYLRSVGFDRVPEPLGVVDGEEVLRLVPGDSGADGWARVVPDDGLKAFARLLRDYHEAVAGYVPPEGARWAVHGGPGETFCHGDFGPWNVVWDGLAPVAILDFDFVCPGPRLDDVAYALEYTAPFRDDATAMRWHRFDAPPDRRRRIEVFAEAYGVAGEGLVDAVIARQELTARHVRMLGEAGVEPQRTEVANGQLEELARRRQWSIDNRELFE